MGGVTWGVITGITVDEDLEKLKLTIHGGEVTGKRDY